MTFSLTDHKERIDTYLDQFFKNLDSPSSVLKEAMYYAVGNGGKRVRAHLVLTTAQLFGFSVEKALPTAAAIECIHAYSLIHDDLPAMDNASLRRGKASCWVKYGEATAILAGDALQALAFDILSDEKTHSNSLVRLNLIQLLSRSSGFKGMVGGQMLDMTPLEDWQLSHIQEMQDLKTGCLIAASCESGAILAQQCSEIQRTLHHYGMILGLIFQITDDLLDTSGSSTIIGKPIKQDVHKHTIVSNLGIDQATEYVKQLAAQSIKILSALPIDTTPFIEFVDYVIDRDY